MWRISSALKWLNDNKTASLFGADSLKVLEIEGLILILRCKTKSWFGPKNEAKTSESSLVLAWGQFGPTEMGLFLTPIFGAKPTQL